jgi:hypothetical protein
MTPRTILPVALLFSAMTLQAAGLSTTFVDVVIESAKVGKVVTIHGPEGKGLILKNLGDSPIQVTLKALVPAPQQLRPGAEPMPELQWVRFDPPSLLIAPRGEGEVKVSITIPDLKKYRNRRFQVMVWSKGEAARAQGITYNAALLSNLRIHTLP